MVGNFITLQVSNWRLLIMILQGLVDLCNLLRIRSTERGAGHFSLLSSDRIHGNGTTAKWEVQAGHQEECLYCEGGQMLQQASKQGG